MKILIVGATGTIGGAVAQLLGAEHEVIRASRGGADLQVDLGSKASIENLFRRIDKVDAIVSAAGEARFGAFDALSDEDFHVSLSSKLMGQVNLARIGALHVADSGSITLTSGVLSREPMPGSAAISLVNAGLEGFVRAAALELPRAIRINVVSPIFVTETAQAMGLHVPSLSAADTAKAYRASIVGAMTGQVLDVRNFV